MPRFFLLLVFIIPLLPACKRIEENALQAELPYSDAKPYTRWWWFASVFGEEDIAVQLDWMKENNFGGVEIAFIYPVNRDPDAERFEWLGDDLQSRLVFTKQYADSIGLGCDFTFGTLWPFGGTFVSDGDRTQIYGDPGFRQPLRLSWTHPDTGNVLNHMDSNAFLRYAKVMGEALKPALKGSTSALFCDSWEVETRKIWTLRFGEAFLERYGYDLRPYMENIYDPANAGARYDYMQLVSEFVISNFYLPFTEACHRYTALSRVQCAGSPTDLITAYAAADVPESEAMLYNPEFSVIPASVAALSNKPIVSAESFTCLYGWPAHHMEEEKILDLKLVADALFANGVNHIIWHGTPFSPKGVDTIRFYATVHVGKKGSLSKHLADFNLYLDKVSRYLKSGKTYSDVAVYLPLEDSWIAGEYPDSLQMPWSWGEYELRYLEFNDEIKGRHPLWINRLFLEQGEVAGNKLHVNGTDFSLLYIDVEYLDVESLDRIIQLAKAGLPVCLKAKPKQPGMSVDPEYDRKIEILLNRDNVSMNLPDVHKGKPLLRGEIIPEYWCRVMKEKAFLFIAHPATIGLSYPLKYGQSDEADEVILPLTITWNGKSFDLEIKFEANQSVLFELSDGGFRRLDIDYLMK